MIRVDLPAAMHCEAKGCEARLGVDLCVTLGGTLAAKPPLGHGWQIGATQQGILTCRCPEHHSKIEAPPEMPLRDVLAGTRPH